MRSSQTNKNDPYLYFYSFRQGLTYDEKHGFVVYSDSKVKKSKET